jgi:hypothetical protein
VIGAWSRHYSEVRPHSSLGYLTPAGSIAKALAVSVRATGRDAAVQRAFAVRPVAPDQERGMIAYRCYLLGGDGKIKRAEVIECPTDAAALQEAERRFVTCEHPSIEVWERARRVGIVGYSTDHAGMRAPGREASINLARVQKLTGDRGVTPAQPVQSHAAEFIARDCTTSAAAGGCPLKLKLVRRIGASTPRAENRGQCVTL